MILSPKSLEILSTVHPDLQRVINLAITRTTIQFEVIQGLRTAEEEMALWLSCHNPDGSRNDQPWKCNTNGYDIGELAPNGIQGTGVSNHQQGLAIDFGAFVNGIYDGNSLALYRDIAGVILGCAASINIPIGWGGSWLKPDNDHIELNRRFYS